MILFNTYGNLGHFKHLPLFSRFLLDSQLDAFVEEQLSVAYQLDLPLLKHLKNYTRQQLMQVYKASMTDYLQHLSQNKGKELIEASLQRWETDQLEVIGKKELVAEDITLINYMRAKTLRKFVPLFNSDIETVLELVEEIDLFSTSATTLAFDTYIRILRQHIAKNEQELLDAQRIALIGNFEYDLENNTSANSPEIYRIFEIDKDTKPNMFMDFIHKDDKKKVDDYMKKAFDEGSFGYEYRFVKGGKTKYIYSKGIVVYEGQKPKKIIGTTQDITNLKQIEQELLEKTVALERSNESLLQFAQVASHDLKEPVRKISLFSDQVIRREKNVSDATKSTLQKIHHSSARMVRMIDDIMNYSTVTQWEEKQLTDLDEIIKEALDFLEYAIEEKNAVIKFSHLPSVNVIRSQFRQLFQNLFANALKFSKPGEPPEISITCTWLNRNDITEERLSVAEKYLRVSVKDNGIGFNQEFSSKIFRLFSRLHNKNQYEGSGLGLAIAKRIIDHHGGVIYATSAEGEGADFTFIIPA